VSYSVSVQDALSNLFYGGSANVPWERALDGLSAAQATLIPAGLPHSVADIVAHVQFWQQYLLDVCRGEDPDWVNSAAEGWPGLVSDDSGERWEVLKLRFLRDMDALADYAQDEAFMHLLDPQGRFRIVPLTSFAGHGLYHLGQVVTVRQLIGAWPPPGGGDTW
jgi:DinB superfamily